MLLYFMKRCSYIIFGVLIYTSVSSEGGFVGPNNTAVDVGSRTTLNCSTNFGSPNWSWYKNTGTLIAFSPARNVYPCIVDPLYISQYNVSSPSNGSYCNLIILNATSADAGSYFCSDGSTEPGKTVTLLVLDSGPHCSTDASNNTVYPGQVTMNCSVQYNSSSGWTPSVQWNTTGSTSSGSSGTTAYSTFTYNTSASTPIPSYSCSVVYNSSVFVDIPACSTNPVTVFWCPIEVTISGAPGGSIARGSSLTCSASGNPSPTYQWFNSTNNLLANGSSLTVWNQDNYTCTASNNANRSLCSRSAFQFVNVGLTTNDNTTPPPLGLILGLVLGLVIPCLVGLAIGIMCCCKRKPSETEPENSKQKKGKK